jgi:hypothetical protein
MPASDSGMSRYRQNRCVNFMISSLEFRGLNAAARCSFPSLSC